MDIDLIHQNELNQMAYQPLIDPTRVRHTMVLLTDKTHTLRMKGTRSFNTCREGWPNR